MMDYLSSDRCACVCLCLERRIKETNVRKSHVNTILLEYIHAA